MMGGRPDGGEDPDGRRGIVSHKWAVFTLVAVPSTFEGRVDGRRGIVKAFSQKLHCHPGSAQSEPFFG